MNGKEYKQKCESMFAKNTVLINRIAELEKENKQLKAYKTVAQEEINNNLHYEVNLELQIEELKEQIAEQKMIIERFNRG